MDAGIRNDTNPVYTAWKNARKRCRGASPAWRKSYTERGITFSPDWDDFAVFAADMGPRPPGTSLERIDNNKGYSKGNCAWATRRTQQNNTRANHMLNFEGQAMSIADWARAKGINQRSLRSRLVKGWTVADALTIPVKGRGQ